MPNPRGGPHVRLRSRSPTPEVRSWRQLSIRATAELPGLSYGYLAKLERGERPVNSRRTLEALAHTLRISPVELTGKPWAPTNPTDSDAHAALHKIETTLDTHELGHDPETPLRPWPEIHADIQRLIDLKHVYADYAAQGELIPQLLPELHAAYVREPAHREETLLGLIQCYAAACGTTRRLGGRGLAALSVRLVQEVADELGIPKWRGYAVWLRGNATGELDRARQYHRSVRMADELTPHLDEPESAQMYGMLHLSAALAAAAQGDRDTCTTHLDEADSIADRLDTEVGTFAKLWFGRPNIGIWKVTIAPKPVTDPRSPKPPATPTSTPSPHRAEKPSSTPTSAAPCCKTPKPATRACPHYSPPNASPHNASTTMSTSAKPSPTNSAASAATPEAANSAASLGAWESPQRDEDFHARLMPHPP